MKFSPGVIDAKPRERLRIRLRTVGTLPKIAMARSFVLLKKDVGVQALDGGRTHRQVEQEDTP